MRVKKNSRNQQQRPRSFFLGKIDSLSLLPEYSCPEKPQNIRVTSSFRYEMMIGFLRRFVSFLFLLNFFLRTYPWRQWGELLPSWKGAWNYTHTRFLFSPHHRSTSFTLFAYLPTYDITRCKSICYPSIYLFTNWNSFFSFFCLALRYSSIHS